MMMQSMFKKVVVFDLDDTLYKEIDFLQSAYRHIANHIQAHFAIKDIFDQMMLWYRKGLDVFQNVIDSYHLPLKKEELIQMYREHIPVIRLDAETADALERLSKNPNIKLGIITDGRVVSQMNKIHALGLLQYVSEEDILISEAHGHQKPNEYAFSKVEQRYEGCEYTYVGDNPQKDFFAPNQLGWKTICLLDDGKNIHPQVFSFPEEYLPKMRIRNMKEIIGLI